MVLDLVVEGLQKANEFCSSKQCQLGLEIFAGVMIVPTYILAIKAYQMAHNLRKKAEQNGYAPIIN